MLDGEHWLWGLVMMLAFWGAILALVYVALSVRHDGRPAARDVLDERSVKGELSSEEYRALRAALDGRADRG